MSSPWTRNGYVRKGALAGSSTTLPVVTSNLAPWRGHVTTLPSMVPNPSMPPSWVQASTTA